MALTEDFIDALYGSAEGRVSVWWREHPGSKSPYSKSAWFSWPKDREDMVEFIDSLSDKDVCVTTTTYSLDRRIPEHVDRTSMIWMDSDVCAGTNYRVPPTWTITTSAGRWQHFWQLAEPVEAIRASELVHRISIAHDKDGADQSSWPANKIMRVPGTMNTSHGFPTRVKAEVSGLLFDITELEAPYADVVIPDRALVRAIPDLHVEDLPAYGNVIAKLNHELLELVTSEPRVDQDRSRMRYRMLCDLFRAGLSFEEVLSVAWHAPASRKWSEEDPRGIGGLAGEAMKAMGEAGAPSAEPAEVFGIDSDSDDELAIEKPVVILTDEERELANEVPKSKKYANFIHWYVHHATESLPHDNRAYDRMNAWLILSLAYMDTGFIPRPDGSKGGLNFFGMTLGETTSGKSSSLSCARQVWRELFYDDPEFNLGGNASETALVRNLHARDGQPSLFQSDEASGVLKVWTVQDWSGGMQERITELYDGEVNPLLRAGKGESINKTSRALFDVFLQGTQKGVLQYMTPQLFDSGFIPRFIYAIGNPPRVNYDSFVIKEGDAVQAAKGFDPVARAMAAYLRANRKAIREYYQGAAPITLDANASKRIADAAWALTQEYKTHQLFDDMIKPSIFRWQNNVHKAACLLAMDDRRTEVNAIDMLQALEAGEEWFTNLLRIINRLSAGAQERALTDIYSFVTSKGGRVTEAALYKRFPGFRGWEMEDYLKVLSLQERVSRKTVNGRKYFIADTWKAEE